MQIWVDADASPAAAKEILFRAAERTCTPVTLVANRMLRTPPSRFVRALQVPGGFDAADREIAQRVQAGDLVVTADIPLAAEAIARGAQVISPRGEVFSAANIGERLAMRDVMEELRAGGVVTGGPSAYAQSDRHAFARQLDRLLGGQARPAQP